MTAPPEHTMAHCRDCAHRLGSGCGCECCDPSALILRAISDPGSITPRRRTCGNCQRVLVDEDEAGWYYQAPVTDPEVPGLTFMDRVHECHGAPHAVDLESMLQWQARAAVQAALPVVRAAAEREMQDALRAAAAELEPEGRIGRTLLTGAYPTNANVARAELLRRFADLPLPGGRP